MFFYTILLHRAQVDLMARSDVMLDVGVFLQSWAAVETLCCNLKVECMAGCVLITPAFLLWIAVYDGRG